MGTNQTIHFDSAYHLGELLEIQQQVIAKIALSSDLYETLEHICSGIEKIFSATDAKSSVLLLSGEQLRHGAAPSLPKLYCEAIDGVKIGPSVGSCGTVAFTKQRYVAKDINSDPKWSDYKALALGHGLQACWSSPIKSTQGDILGTFAVYYGYPNSPSEAELKVIDRFTHLTSLAIEKHSAFNREVELNNQLRLSHSKIETITGVLPDLLFVFDEDGNCVDSYGVDANQHKMPSKNQLGRLINSKDSAAEFCTCQDAIAKTLNASQMQIFEYQVSRGSATYYYESRITPLEGYALNGANYVLWLARDITERKEAQDKIQELAYHDLLTNLPNRRYLLSQLQQTIDDIGDSRQVGALLYLDLDNFKGVNDSLGHSAGDSLLRDICSRLSIKLSEKDMFARIGGDEFVILLTHFFDNEQQSARHAQEVAERLIAQLSRPFSLCGREVTIEASIGITFINQDEMHADEVLMRADTAMYSAKRNIDKSYCFFDPALHESLKQRFRLENELKEAIRRREIITFFQPQIDVNNSLVGAEALVRWLHPERGLIPPLDFISVAEEIGVIDSLQSIVMDDSCQLLHQLFEEHLVDDQFTISINVSATQFCNSNLSESLTHLFERQRISPKHITLELTESMLVEEIDSAIKQMHALKQQGFRLSIDDFGTGYSSLAYLQKFPIDELKIDKSFVDNLEDAKVGSGIVDTIIALAEHMNFEVVAEGVEHAGQVSFFQRRKIFAMQGYHFAKPMPEEDLKQWLESGGLC